MRWYAADAKPGVGEVASDSEFPLKQIPVWGVRIQEFQAFIASSLDMLAKNAIPSTAAARAGEACTSRSRRNQTMLDAEVHARDQILAGTIEVRQRHATPPLEG